MRKYETKLKLRVVESFLAGEGSTKLLAQHWSVPEEKIRIWVSHYRLHGVAGLQPKRSAYTADYELQLLAHQDRIGSPVGRLLLSTIFAIRTRLSFGGAPSMMGGLSLKSLDRPKRYRSYRGESASSPNVLDRQFDAARPNEKWVTDLTEFSVRGAKL